MTDLPLGSRRHARGLGWPRSGAQPEPRRYTLATTTPSPELVPVTPAFTNTQRLALAGFLAGHSGQTRQALRAGPAPVRVLVPAPPGAPIRRPPRRHRVLRP